MNWTVDTPIFLGDTLIAAIVETKVSVNAVGPAWCGWAQKTPLLFVQVKGGDVSGLDVNGHIYEAEQIEHLYPTAIAKVRGLQDENT